MMRLSSSMLIASGPAAVRMNVRVEVGAARDAVRKGEAWSNIPALDFFAQGFDDVRQVAYVGIDRQRCRITLQCVLVVADVLQDQPQPGDAAAMPRVEPHDFA